LRPRKQGGSAALAGPGAARTGAPDRALRPRVGPTGHLARAEVVRCEAMQIHTVGELLHWSYANLAMNHAAHDDGAKSCGRRHFIIRSRLYAGLRGGTMQLGSLADDERLKMILPQACCYCGSTDNLAIDHLVPRARGGADTGDNLVWSCRSCNSSKGSKDVLEWLAGRDQFPPLLLLRRFLKLATAIAAEAGAMDALLTEAPPLPFSLPAIPTRFPPPQEAKLWILPLPE